MLQPSEKELEFEPKPPAASVKFKSRLKFPSNTIIPPLPPNPLPLPKPPLASTVELMKFVVNLFEVWM